MSIIISDLRNDPNYNFPPQEKRQILLTCKGYYTEVNRDNNYVVLQQINTAPLPGVPPPKYGEHHGAAFQRGGIHELFRSPNSYPVGENSVKMAMILQQCDTKLSMVNNVQQPILIQKIECLGYYSEIARLRLDPILEQSATAVGKRVSGSFKKNKNKLAALLIKKTCYGYHLVANSHKSLMAMGKDPKNEWVHYTLVLPLVVLLLQELNPDCHLDFNSIMETRIDRVENNMKRKLLQSSAWSQEYVTVALGWPDNHPAKQDLLDDSDMMAGIEYNFLRLYTLICRDVVLPWNEDKKQYDKLWMWPDQRNRLYKSYDDVHCIRRYALPRNHGATHPNHY